MQDTETMTLQANYKGTRQLDRLEACIMDLDHMPKRYR